MATDSVLKPPVLGTAGFAENVGALFFLMVRYYHALIHFMLGGRLKSCPVDFSDLDVAAG